MLNVETMLRYFNEIRRIYAVKLNERMDDFFSPNEINILILLSNNKHINTSSDLRVMLGVSKGLVSRSIDALLKKGLIVCRSDERDKRIQRIHLTKKAAPVIEHSNHEVQKINDEVLKDVSEADIAHLEITMKKILQCFKDKEENHEN